MSLCLSVSLAFYSFVCGRHLIVIILLRMFYVLLFWSSRKDVERSREKARSDTNCLSYIPSGKNEIKTEETLVVARLLLPAFYLLLSSTVWCKQH